MKRKTILAGVVVATVIAIVAVLVFSSKAPSNEPSNAPAGVYVPGINIQILEFLPQFSIEYGKILLNNIEITAKNLNSRDLNFIDGNLSLYDMENNEIERIVFFTSGTNSLARGTTSTLNFRDLYYDYLAPNTTYTAKMHLGGFLYTQYVSGDYTTTFTTPELPAE